MTASDSNPDELLVQLLDEILPETPSLPAASGVGLAALIAARARQTPDLAAALEEVLRACAAKLTEQGATNLRALEAPARVAILQGMEAERSQAFVQLTRHAHMDYYTHPEVPPRIGMPDRPPQPLGHELPQDDDLDALLAPVRARGKIWRDA